MRLDEERDKGKTKTKREESRVFFFSGNGIKVVLSFGCKS